MDCHLAHTSNGRRALRPRMSSVSSAVGRPTVFRPTKALLKAPAKVNEVNP